MGANQKREYKRPTTCRVCGGSNLAPLFNWDNAPANIGVLWPSKDLAQKCPQGDLSIAVCHSCGFIWNITFDPEKLDYSQEYDNNLHYSKVYDQYARQTAKYLIDRYNLRGKHILEIGCGKGDFLILLSTLGDNHGTGFDSSYVARELDEKISAKISIVSDFYDERYSSYHGDLVVSRYVLEHIPDPVAFLRMVRNNIGTREDTTVYFEVPNAYLILEQLSVWDFIYEHCSYFSPESLTYVFESCGFKVLRVAETFGNQFVTIEAVPEKESRRPKKLQSTDLTRLDRAVSKFTDEVEARKSRWTPLLRKFRQENSRVMVWGAGAKTVSFLNMLDIGDQVPFVVDINPNKHGKFLPGTGQKVVPPEFVKQYRPDRVIVMNPIYLDEIRQCLNSMGTTAEVLTP